jgi:hypothetical protein
MPLTATEVLEMLEIAWILGTYSAVLSQGCERVFRHHLRDAAVQRRHPNWAIDTMTGLGLRYLMECCPRSKVSKAV